MTSRPLRVGEIVRYKPGYGTYGYEDCLDQDGRVEGIVDSFTRTRVRIKLTGDHRMKGQLRAVDAASLERQ